MGWFDNIFNPGGDVKEIGTRAGSSMAEAKSKYDSLRQSQMPVPGAVSESEPFGAPSMISGIPDYTNQWAKVSQNLNTDKLKEGNNTLQAASGGALANATNNLAMKGGLSAGANERLAANNMNGFQDAYSGLATKYGLGASEIDKQGLETKQEMALRLAESKDRAAAARAANQPGLIGGILGDLGLDNLF